MTCSGSTGLMLCWFLTVLVLLFAQVLSGDTIVIRGQPKGGPPPEKTVCLSNIQAPKVARRANPNIEGSTETKDEVSVLISSFLCRDYLYSVIITKLGLDILRTNCSL